MTHKCIQENASTPQNQEEYLKRYNGYVERFEETTASLKALKDEKLLRKARGEAFDDFINTFLKVDSFIEEFDEELWLATVDKVIIDNPEFRFVAGNCRKVLNNTFIMYCDKDGIQRFEKLLNIVGSDNESLEFRQSRVMVRWNDSVPYTLKALTNKLIAMQGNNDIQIILEGYKILIITHMDNAGQSDSLWDLFNTMIPCNMDITHKNLVRCGSSGIIFIAAGTNYTQMTANEYTQWFGSRGTFYVATGMSYARTAVNEFTQHFNSSGMFKIGAGVSYTKVNVNDYVQEFTASGSVKIASGIGDNTGVPDHVGIVEKVSGSTITVIEGNKNNAVERRNIQVNGKFIRGYGVPKYDVETVPKSVLTSANDITWELNHSYFPILEVDNFVKALDAAKQANSPLYWGYYKLVNKVQ